mgnify:CR=1 FL=1|jgi:hypothetical protein
MASPGPGGGGPPVDPAAIMKQRQQQFQKQVEGKILETIIEKCTQKCLSNKGGRLDRSEQHCIANCYDRYWDTRNTIMKEMQGQ